MFNTIRFALAVLILVLLLIFIKNRKTKKIAIAINIVLYLTISIFPYENILFRMQSLESAYEYSFGSSENIVKAYEQGDCGLVFHPNRNGVIFTVFSKDDRGWKITPPSNYTKQKTYKLQDELRLLIKKATPKKNLVLITDLYRDGDSPKVRSVTDSKNSVFLKCELSNAGVAITYYFAFVEWSNPTYTIIVNDVPYTIDQL